MKKIQLLRKRNFGTLLGDIIEFSIQNFIAYVRAFFIIVLPPLLICAVVTALMINHFIQLVQGMYGMRQFDMPMLASFIGSFVVLIILVMFVSVLQNTMAYQYVLLYEQTDDPATITVGMIWQRVKANIGAMVYNLLWYLLFMIVMTLASVTVIAPLMYLSKGFGGFMILPVSLGWIYIIVISSTFFMIRFREGLGAVESFNRAFTLGYGRWWFIFGAFFLITLITYICIGICTSPLTSMAGTSAFPYAGTAHYDLTAIRSPVFGITQAAGMSLNIFFSGIVCFCICITYYSLAAEKDTAEIMSVYEGQIPVSPDENSGSSISI